MPCQKRQQARKNGLSHDVGDGIVEGPPASFSNMGIRIQTGRAIGDKCFRGALETGLAQGEPLRARICLY